MFRLRTLTRSRAALAVLATAASGAGIVGYNTYSHVAEAEKSGGDEYGAGFPLFTEKCNSLVKKHLTVDIYEQLKDKVCMHTLLDLPGRSAHPSLTFRQVTKNGFTLDRAIQSGVDNQDSGVGIYAGDEVGTNRLPRCFSGSTHWS